MRTVASLDDRVRELEQALEARERERGQQAARAEEAEAELAGLRAFRDRVLAHPMVRLRSALRRR